MSAQLTVHNAQITTATVQVKTLTISGKQVTLAVFRQLREEVLLDEDAGELLGVPWGTVNYHPGKCAPGVHLHVVWQHDDELLRATVRPIPLSAPFYSEAADVFVQDAYCANNHNRPDWMQRRRDPDEPGEWCIGFRLDGEFRGIQCLTLGLPESHGHECSKNPDNEKFLREDLAAEHQRRQNLMTHWAALNDRQQTPQLFIAV